MHITLLTLIIAIPLFVWVACNFGEKKGQKDHRVLLYGVIVVLMGYLIYPYIAPVVNPIVSALLSK